MNIMNRLHQMGQSNDTKLGKSDKLQDDYSDECSHTEVSVTTNESEDYTPRSRQRSLSPQKYSCRRNMLARCQSVPVISPVPKHVKAGKSWKISGEPESEVSKGPKADPEKKNPSSSRPTLQGDPGSSRRLVDKQNSLRYLSPPSKDFEAFHKDEGKEKDPEQASSKLLGHPSSPRRKFLRQASDRYMSTPRKEFASLQDAIDDFEAATALFPDTFDEADKKKTAKKEVAPHKQASDISACASSPSKADHSESGETDKAKNGESHPSSPRRVMKKKACARYLSTPRKKFSSLQDAIDDYEEVSQAQDDPSDIREKSFPRSPGICKGESFTTRRKTKRIVIKQASARVLSSQLKELGGECETTEMRNGKQVRRIRVQAPAALVEKEKSSKTPVTPKNAGVRLFKQLSMRLRSPGKKAPLDCDDNKAFKTPTKSPSSSKRAVQKHTSVPVLEIPLAGLSPDGSLRRSPSRPKSPGRSKSPGRLISPGKSPCRIPTKSPRRGMFKQNSARYLNTPRKKGLNIDDVLGDYDKIDAIAEFVEI